jgi:transcriptional regulator with XRE-family HTH domain
MKPRHLHWRSCEYSRPRDNRPPNATYRGIVATSPDVDRARFSRFVARALDQARSRGLTDKDIAAATGVNAATFHRWKRGDYRTAPGVDKVKAFCAGLDIPAAAALLALGLSEGRTDPEPDPVIDPDIRTILRRLADPNVSEEHKQAMRTVLRMLAQQRVPSTPKI